MDQQKNLEKQIEKDQRKERLLHHRGDSPGPSSDNLAKKRHSDSKMRIPSRNCCGKPIPVLNSISSKYVENMSNCYKNVIITSYVTKSSKDYPKLPKLSSLEPSQNTMLKYALTSFLFME
jgi:hypothetical protein